MTVPRHNTHRGKTNFHAGLAAERCVARHYMQQGYRVLAHRYCCEAGEIDLIMKRDDMVFIEVKKAACHYAAAQRVTLPQLRRIYAAAEAYLCTQPDPVLSARIDAAFVDQHGRVSTIENIFCP